MNAPDPLPAAASPSVLSSTRRDRSIKDAVLTSFVSKGGTALLQLLALPVAMRVLGWEEFGVFASVAGVLMTVHLFEMGVGPALVHELSKAAARGDRAREQRLYATSLLLLAALTGLSGIVLGLAIHHVPIEDLFGARFVAFESALRKALWAGLVLFLLSLILSHTDRVREGYLEVRVNNAWGAAGNFLAAGAVAFGVWVMPTAPFLLLAVYGPQVLMKIGNTLFLWRARPWLLPLARSIDWRLSRGLLTDGLAFLVFSLVVNFIEFNVCLNLFGRIAGPVGVTAYSVLITITTALLGFILMFTTPTWPAVVDAKARGDVLWIRRAARKLWMYVICFAAASGVGLILFGPAVLPVWVGDKAHALGGAVMVAYAAYFLVYAWRHANHMLLVGAGRVKTLALVQVVESVLVLAAAWIGMNLAGLIGLLTGMAFTILAVTGWVLPLIFSRELNSKPSARLSPVPPVIQAPAV